MADVASDVISVIGQRVSGEEKALKLSDNLLELGITSLDAIEMLFDLEEKFGIEIPYNANSASELATVGDVVHAIEGIVGKST